MVDYSFVQGIIFGTLYYPQLWPSVSLLLDSLLKYRTTPPAPAYVDAFIRSALSAAPFDALLGIKCGEKFPRRSSLAELLPDLIERHQMSRLGDAIDAQPVFCSQWKMEAKERYGGDFKVKTRNPVLLIGNTFDPVTPIVGARNMSLGFEGSVVMEHNGYGVSELRCFQSLLLLANCYGLFVFVGREILNSADDDVIALFIYYASFALYGKGHEGIFHQRDAS
jgi:hypothetical protein